jgi:hypothetical protein
MSERVQTRRRESGGSGPFGANDLFAPLDEGQPVTVTHGPYAEELPAGGLTVGEIRRRYGDRFDIDPLSEAIVDGTVVGDDTTVRAGQMLTFARRAGEKGER